MKRNVFFHTLLCIRVLCGSSGIRNLCLTEKNMYFNGKAQYSSGHGQEISLQDTVLSFPIIKPVH